MKKYLITGTSTGIGLATAQSLIAGGCHVFGSVRKKEDGEKLRHELGEKFTPLVFDVTDHQSVKYASDKVREELVSQADCLSGIVNNAGIAVSGPALHVSMDRWRQQFEVNYFGQIAVIQAFCPLMGAGSKALPVPDEKKFPRRIVNISSISGLVAFPFFAPYAGSKFALEALTDSLRRELLLYGIDVVAVEPGRIATPIWNKARQRARNNEFADTDYGPTLEKIRELTSQEKDASMLPVERVSETVTRALLAKKVRTRYVIPDKPFEWKITNWLTDRTLDRIIGRKLGFLNQKK